MQLPMDASERSDARVSILTHLLRRMQHARLAALLVLGVVSILTHLLRRMQQVQGQKISRTLR